jgi:hypothetical protein
MVSSRNLGGTMTSRLITSITVGALVLGLSACSPGTSYPQDAAEAYFSGIFAVSPEDTLAAKQFAVPGSNAEAYAIEQAALKQAMMDGGNLDQTKVNLVLKSDQVFGCPEGVDLEDPEQTELCPSFSNLEFDGDKLVNFDAGDSSLDGRIAVGDGTEIPIGSIGTAKYIAAYVNMAGDLTIILEVTSNTSELSRNYDSIYLSASGRQVELSSWEGPDSLKEGRTGNVAFLFSGAEIGGSLEASFYDADYNDVIISISIK